MQLRPIVPTFLIHLNMTLYQYSDYLYKRELYVLWLLFFAYLYNNSSPYPFCCIDFYHCSTNLYHCSINLYSSCICGPSLLSQTVLMFNSKAHNPLKHLEEMFPLPSKFSLLFRKMIWYIWVDHHEMISMIMFWLPWTFLAFGGSFIHLVIYYLTVFFIFNDSGCYGD